MRLPLAALLTLSACQPAAPEEEPLGPADYGCASTGLIGTLGPPIGRALTPSTAQLYLPLRCTKLSTFTARAAVLDENSVSIEVTGVEASQDELGVFARVTFTPPSPGTYHVTAELLPSLGVVQADVVVASTLDVTAPLIAVPVSPELLLCTHFEVSEDQQLLCLAPFVTVYGRDGVRTQQLAASGIGARSGRVLWVNDHSESSAGVRHCTESAGAFTCTGGPAIRSPVLLPLGDEVIAFDRTTIVQLELERGEVRQRVLNELASIGAPLVGARNGSTYWWISPGGTCTASLTKVGTEVCSVTTSLRSAQPLASDGSGIWLSSSFGAMLGLATPNGVVSITLPRLTTFELRSGLPTPGGVGFPIGTERFLADAYDGHIRLQRAPPEVFPIAVMATTYAALNGLTLELHPR